MKNLFKRTRVIHNPNQRCFIVEYNNFIFWRSEFWFGYTLEQETHKPKPNKETAEKKAIERAQELLNIAIVWEGNNLHF
jgi:hypothetical protein